MMALHRAARKRKTPKIGFKATANSVKPDKSSSIKDGGGGNCAFTEPTKDG